MRGTTRTVAVAALSAVALLAAGCGSGDSDDTATTAAGGKTGGEITVRGCNPAEPARPEQHHGDLRWQRHRRGLRQARPLRPRDCRAQARHRRVDRDDRQPELHGEAEAGLQVPRRHRGHLQELRRRVELRGLRPERAVQRLLHGADRGLRRPPVRRHHEPRRPVRGLHPEGQGDDRPQGRRRQHLHHQDHREGLEPPRASGLLGLRAAAGRSSSPTPRPSATSPSAPARSSSTPGPRSRRSSCPSSPTTRASSAARSTRSPSRSTRTPTPPTTTSSPTTSTSPTRSRPAP